MKISLNNDWKFKIGFNEDYLKEMPEDSSSIDLPHNIKNVPINYFGDQDYQEISTYRKEFEIDENIKDKKVFLNFEGFMLKADIYLNDKYLGRYISGFVPVSIDISKVAKSQNVLIVKLDSHEDKTIPPFGYVVDYYTFGGIYRGVNIEIKDKVYFSNLLVNANMHGEVKIIPEIINEEKLEYETYFEVYDSKDKLVISSQEKTFKVENYELWNLDNPILYTLKAVVKSTKTIDIFITKFGFRSAEFRKNGFYLNNERIKLFGLNRHQCYPYVGYAATKILQEEDADILKNELGVNIVRTSHYPQSEYFLNKCDELGLLFIDEIPGWQYVGKDKEWRDNYYTFLTKMIHKECNHPSLVGYGVRIDESQDDLELYGNGNEIVHNLDPFRQTLGVRNFKNDFCQEDIYAYNDFSSSDLSHGFDNPKTCTNTNKPYIISEYLGHMFPTKPNDDVSRRLTHALRHARVLSDGFKYDRISACIGWCFVDYYTHSDFGSGDHICYHGVMDLFRNPKYAGYIYSSQFVKKPVLEVLSNMTPGDNNEALIGETLVATNVDYIELYKADNLIGKFYPNKKYYPNLPHPLVVIDDYIGKTFKEDNLKPRYHKTVIKLINKLAMFGMKAITKKDMVQIKLIMIRNKLSYPDLVNYFNKYVASWGGHREPYTFKGYINNQLVISKIVGTSSTYHLSFDKEPYTFSENDGNYEILPIKVKYLNEFNNLMTYCETPLEVEASGSIELVSPKVISFIGGIATIYVRSIHQTGLAKVKVTAGNLQAEATIIIK